MNTYIRGIIKEMPAYLVVISEYKYQVVTSKYESLVKGTLLRLNILAYKIREDLLLKINKGLSKAIEEEEKSKEEQSRLINEIKMGRPKVRMGGVKRNEIFMGLHTQSGTIASLVNDNIAPQQETRRTKDDSQVSLDYPLDVLSEQDKLKSLQSNVENSIFEETKMSLFHNRNLANSMFASTAFSENSKYFKTLLTNSKNNIFC